MGKQFIGGVLATVFHATVYYGSAATISIPQPSPTAFADGEAVAFADFSIEAPGTFSATASFTASPTNCVELVFGRDSNFDGAISWREALFKVGWDAGEWLASSPVTGETLVANPVSPNPQKTLSLFARIDSNGGVAALSICENGIQIFTGALPLLAETGRVDLWNCVGQISRGDPGTVAASVAAHRDGSVLVVM